MEAAVYITFDDWSKNQDSTPLIWIEQLGQNLVDLDVNPDHVVGFLRDIHLGTRTAGTMATWIAENRRAPWSTFKGAFLRLNPGKPPKITRLTWKALSMSKQGSYHAYLSEFNRQKALISTGPDEVIETFLLGLTPSLRTQVEFNHNRTWRFDDFDVLVDTTTERVNSTATLKREQIVPRSSEQSTRSQNRRADSNRQKRHFSVESTERPAVTRPTNTGNTGNNGSHVGRTANESLAITQYCWDHQLCKFCRAPLRQHRSRDCPRKGNPPQFRFPDRWDEQYWLDKNRASAAERDQQKGDFKRRKHN